MHWSLGVRQLRKWLAGAVLVGAIFVFGCPSERTTSTDNDTGDDPVDAAMDVADDAAEPMDAGDTERVDAVSDVADDVSKDTDIEDMGLPPSVDCTRDAQCASEICREGSCVPASCGDGVQNQDETDVDCGGSSCGPCSVGDKCGGPEDCTSDSCTSGTCADPSCSDGIKNQGETDVDCGGSNCSPCANGDSCSQSGDCQSGACVNQVCRPASCRDGVKNNMETGVDCGGPNCPKCENGASCGSDDDCQNVCGGNGNCVTCKNGNNRKIAGASCGYQQRGTLKTKQTCQNNQWVDSTTECTGVYYKSCAEIDDAQTMPSDGTYTLDPDGPGSGGNNVSPFSAYCMMTYDGSRTGGWTLVLKVDGTTSHFEYGDGKWTNSNLYNGTSLQPFNGTEAKLASYMHVPFSQVHLVFETSTGGGTAQNSLSLYGQASSMHALISSNQYVQTYAGRSAWLGLMPNPSVQSNCNREGFNVDLFQVDIRIGLAGNNESGCGTPDSYIGVGGSFPSWGPDVVAAGWLRSFGDPTGSEAATAIVFVE